MTRHHMPKRTCIGCRQTFGKNDVVRIVAGPAGAVIDYREKLPGRAAYVCPRRGCIERALVRQHLSRALLANIDVPDATTFIERLAGHIADKVRSLILMSAKAGKLAAGASAVEDALGKGRAELLLFARDISDGTRSKLLAGVSRPLRKESFLTCDELGRMLGRETIAVVCIIEKSFADAVEMELARLKGLLNTHL